MIDELYKMRDYNKDDFKKFEIDAGIDIYNQHSITIVKDQHFYENIGKYNEFFSGWVDADIDNIIVETTGQNYTIALSPKKNS